MEAVATVEHRLRAVEAVAATVEAEEHQHLLRHRAVEVAAATVVPRVLLGSNCRLWLTGWTQGKTKEHPTSRDQDVTSDLAPAKPK